MRRWSNLILTGLCLVAILGWMASSGVTLFAQDHDARPQTGFELPTADVQAAGDRADQQAGDTASSQVIGNRNLFDIIRSGGPLMIPIGICSFILLVFVFERLIMLRRGLIIPGPFVKRFLEQLREGELNRDSAVTICERNGTLMADVFKAGVLKWGRPAVEVEQAVMDEGERVGNRLRKYLRLFNGISTLSPLLGLLGTVLGMIHSFDSIAATAVVPGDPKSLIATGISQALITTAAGMSVAIPALIAYLYFSSRADKLVMEIDSLGMKVVHQISSEALQASGSTSTARRGKAA